MLIALVSLCCVVSAQAQTLKFGHINVQELIHLMPERDSAVVGLEKYRAELEETLVGIQNEYQVKLADYQQRHTTWTAAILETKQQELSQIQQRMEQFLQTAQQELEQMQNILYAPVYDKADVAIQKVAKDMGLIYVFNSAGMPYIDESQSEHLLERVKAELKIPAEKVAPTPLGGQQW